MPRFPVLPQRTSVPAAFSNTPRAQVAHFGAGIGRNLAEFGAEAVELGQEVQQRQERQVKQQMSQFDLELAKERAQSDAEAPPEEASEAKVERYQLIFETSAEKLLQGYKGQGLQSRLREDIELRREAYTQRLLAGEAQQRLRASLEDARRLVEHWSTRVAVDATVFNTASQELLGDESSGEAGLLAGLGLRPEALVAWRSHVLNQLLDAKMQSDPAGLVTDLEAGIWQDLLREGRRKSLLEDAEEALTRRTTIDEVERTRTSASKSLELSQAIDTGKAGLADIRQAEEAGALASSQAEALRGKVAHAETALQAQQMASDELAISLSSGVGFDLANPQNRHAAESFYETTYSQAIRAGASEVTRALVVSAVAKTGYLPPRLARDTTGLLHSRDSAWQLAGAELYGGLRDAVPEIVALAFDPETRARGGILKRWLDMGLEPADALQRAGAEWPGDDKVRILEVEEMEALKRDLESLFSGAHSGHHVDQILGQLERNYLDDLGKGLTPRLARQQHQRDVGRVMRKLTPLKDAARDVSDLSGDGRSSLLIPAGFIPAGVKQAPRGGGGKPGSNPKEWWLGPPANPLDDELANAAGLELERVVEDIADWMVESYIAIRNMRREFDARTFPDSAASRSKDAMVSIGDGKNYLSKIKEENGDEGTRSLAFQYPGLGLLTVRQKYNISTERFENLDVTFKDPETGEEITEELPSSRFYVPSNVVGDAGATDGGLATSDITGPDETSATGDHARVTPSDQHRPTILPGRPSEPIPVTQLPPSEPGRGRELVPNNTGGNQTDVGPLTDLAPGFPVHEQEPQIYITPDQSGELPKTLTQKNESDDDKILEKRGVMLPPERLNAAPTRSEGAPIGDDGHPIELHHPDQDPNKPLVEMTRTEHRLGENYKNNHPNNKRVSRIDRKQHDSIRKNLYRIDKNNGRFDFFKDEKHPAHPNNRRENIGPDSLRDPRRKKHPKSRRNVR